VVTPPPDFGDTLPPAQPVSSPQAVPVDDDGSTARINFRLSEQLKARIEEAAGRDGISVNAWLVRAASAAVTGGIPPAEPAERRPAASGQRFTGWVR
jgi:hypothetical protein